MAPEPHRSEGRDRGALGAQLATRRAKKGLTQAGLAAATGIHQSEISRIERGIGNPTQDTLDRLGRALGTRLAFGSPDAEPSSASLKAASTYATGGGGVRFEHLTGSHFLVALLLDRSPAPLWESSSLTAVRFQQRAEGANLDDVVLVASGPKDAERLVEVAIRHRPKFTTSDAKFVTLLANCLRSLSQHGTEFDQDLRRLCIVVAEGTPRSADVRKLTEVARSHPTAAAFAAAVKDNSNLQVISVKDNLRKAVDAAQQIIDPGGPAPSDQEFLRLLSALHVIPLDLEGASARDRVAMVNDVVPAVRAADHGVAASLVARVTSLAADWSTGGAAIDERLLRRALIGEFDLTRSPRHPTAWALLERLSERAESAIHTALGGGFHLDRDAVHDALVAAIGTPSPLLLTGEPGTGKSAACRTAARASGGQIIFLTLRDLPATMLEFESQLGCSLSDALGGAHGGGRPVVVIDGAEAALENRVAFLRDLLSSIPFAADRWQVCLVSRTEGSRKLQDLARQVWPQAKLMTAEIPGLDEAELSMVADAFPQLRHLLSQPRARWLLSRPKLLDLVLKQGMEEFLQRDLICEADVMDAVWNTEVRLGEVMGTPRGSPDGREQALLALARAHLRGDPVAEVRADEPAALSGLRADGLLRGGGGTRVQRGPLDFAHDVIRDFAVAEVLLQSDDLVSGLLGADAPRWSLRACRLACQARLGDPAHASLEGRLASLDTAFGTVAARSGERWSEVPWEALITMAQPQRALRTLWPRLVDQSAAGILRILGVLKHRFTTPGGMVDSTIWQPVLEVLLESHTELPEMVLGELDRAVVSLLESAAVSALGLEAALGSTDVIRPASSEPLREAVVRLARRYLLARLGPRNNRLVLRGLALLGPGIDDAVEQALRDAAANRADELRDVVDHFVVARRVVDTRPDLLVDLAAAYYIDDRQRDSQWWGYSPLHDGVRDHKTGHIGFPFANWYYGPFFMLLQERPVTTMSFLNRLFDHAAEARISSLSSPQTSAAPEPDHGITLRLVGAEETTYIGDSHVYYWYRGTAVGPHPCVSALLALELYIDRLIDSGLPLAAIGRWLLKDAHNLATVGLWVGVLVRHIDKVTDELDILVSSPAIWELETARVTADLGGYRAQQPAECHGADRRAWTFSQVAGWMILNLRPERVDRLRQIREALLAAPGDKATLRNWASQLDPTTYRLETADQGILVTQHPPQEVAAELERLREPGRHFMELSRLSFAYGRLSQDAPPIEPNQLRADLRLVRDFEEHPSKGPGDRVLDAIAATAAAALRCHFDDTCPLLPDDLTWCASIIVEFAEAASRRSSEIGVIPEERWEMGWDRAAARALPLLLSEIPDLAGLDGALVSLARSPYHETQQAFADALGIVWTTSCRGHGAVPCTHERAFTAMVEMAAHVGLAPWDQELQVRPRQRLADPVLESVRACPGDMVNFTDMAGAATALSACATSGSCVATHAQALLDAFLDLHARAWVSWASREGYVDTSSAASVNAVAAKRVLTGDDALLERSLITYADHTVLAAALLDALAAAATSDELQRRLTAIWPGLMDRLIPTLNGADRRRHYHSDEALVEALLPLLPPGTELVAWPHADVIEQQVALLIQSQTSDAALVNQLIRYLDPQPRGLQLTYGLDWFLTLTIGHESYLAGRTRMAGWLRKVRDEGAGDLGPSARAKWQRLVDALAAAGDESCVRLQQEEE